MTGKEQIKKKKILIFHPALAPYRIDQLNALGELFDLEVVFLLDKLWNFNIDNRKLQEECRFKNSFLLKGFRHKGRLFRFGMYRIIREVKPDIIFGYEYSFTTQYLILLKTVGFIRQKVGSFIDDSPDICINVQSALRAFIRNRSVRHLDFLVVMSEEVSRFYQESFSIQKKQVIVSPILQLPERLRRDQEKIESIALNHIRNFQLKGKTAILFVGRFIPEKALPLFISTISNFLAERENFLLVLVGEGSDMDQLKTIVNEKKLEGKVIFPGKYQGKELFGWYACVSGFVLPSLSETFGAVVNEALIFGLKVLCSKFAGASCLINPGNGEIFNPLDSADTLEKFSRFLDSLQPVGEVNLTKRVPLIDDHTQQFIHEWRKLTV